EFAKLKANAGPHVSFLGWQPDSIIRDHLRRAKALLFPGEEDFGIVPLEAHACGCPVVGYGCGGLTETVRPLNSANNPTGVFFDEQTVDAFAAALDQFERNVDCFNPHSARQQALLFRKQRFETELFGLIDEVLAGKQETV